MVRSTLSTRGTSSWFAQHRHPEGHLLGPLNMVNQRDIFLLRSTSSTRGTSSWSAQHGQPEGHLHGPLDIVTQQGLLQVPTRKRKQPLGETTDNFSVASESLPRTPSLDIVTSVTTDIDIVTQQGLLQVPTRKRKQPLGETFDDFSVASESLPTNSASQGSLRKDRVKERLARIASRNASQGSLRKDRFTRTALQGPLHKNHFTRAASQAQNKFETLSTSVQRIHHRKSKQLGETFDDFSVEKW